MSAFEVIVSPKSTNTKNESRSAVDVILAPFSAKAIVTFEGVPVTKLARRTLNILNPSENELKVMLTKGLNPAHNMSMEWTSNIIPPMSERKLELVWNPLIEVTCKETIQFTDSRNFRKDVSVILKSTKPKKIIKRFPTLSSGPVPVKTLKLKQRSPVINKMPNRKSMSANVQYKRQSLSSLHYQHTQSLQQSTTRYQKQSQSNNIATTNIFETSEFNFQFNSAQKYTKPYQAQNKKSNNKENVSPTTPENASSLFDNLKFTPATETLKNPSPNISSFEYLASLPTPINSKGSTRRSMQSEKMSVIKPRRINIPHDENDLEISPNILPRITVEEILPTNNCSILPRSPSPGRTFIKDSILDTSDTRKSLLPLINKTFDLHTRHDSRDNLTMSPRESLDCGLNMSIVNTIPNGLNESITISGGSSRLSIIAEGEESLRGESNRKSTQNGIPYEMDVNLIRDIKLVGTPLRKFSESMRDLSAKSLQISHYAIQGSMPNLNNLESLQSIEKNRYYYQQQNNIKSENLSNISASSDLVNTSATSLVSNAELAFNQSEILAASSRFNVNEVGKRNPNIKSEPKTPSITSKICSTPSPSKQEYLNKRSRSALESPVSAYSLKVPRPYTVVVSPPKRTRYDINISPNTPSRSFRQPKSAYFQTKKIRLQKTLSLVKKPITPRKIKEEPRQFLYNSETFLQPFINPDPFAATTTCDPFLAHSMFLDERSTDKYEIQFKKWLNALVSMPSELDPDCDQNIDVGRLFNEVRNKELILAPTKEEQSMNYLTKSRMESLRSAALRLFMSEEMVIPCSKVAVYIKKSSIKIRQDRDLHLDVVMQRNILELLLCFNPLWLRIGLEVVFGEVIHLHSNSDIVGLSTFILNRLFKDKFLERKYSRAYTLSQEYAQHIKTFTLQKFLFLLLFLDKAKNNRIIKHNPCLFVKKSQHKETRDILLRFSSELLASVGDITKELRRLGYLLTHKQSFIEEFDYAFKNLGVDLRDGIRLNRVMEIILLRENLINQLRCPAISRLQRVYNVNLALNALSAAEFQLKGNISAGDIVDGHREKTLSLLWQIIYKFRSPKFIAAANVLQQWWRKSWLKVIIQRRINYKKEMKRHRAATVIQCAFRGFMARKYSKIIKWERTTASICLQKYFRGYLARKKLIITTNCIVYIQRWYRRTKISKLIRMEYTEIRHSTIIIQQWYRRIKLANKLKLVAPIIKQAKAEAKLRHEKTIIIQRCIKSYTIHKKLKSIVYGFVNFIRKSKTEYKSASKIQSIFKSVKLRREFLLKKHSAIKIQQHWRSYQLTKLNRAQFIGQRRASIAIQQYFRSYCLMKIERRSYLELRKSILFVQNSFRANKLCNVAKASYQKLKSNTITIQKYLRATVLMRKVREEYIITRRVTIQIQQRFRANKTMRLQNAEYHKIKSATITIQQHYRAQVLMKKHQAEFSKLKVSSIFIQQKLRATLLAKRKQLEYLELRRVTTNIQKLFKANQQMKIERAKFLKFKHATLAIQCQYRANLQMRKDRAEFLKNKNAAIKIQKYYKATVLMRKERTSYAELKSATLIIQHKFRANRDMKIQNAEYLKLKKYTIIIQKIFKANCAMKYQRSNFLRMKDATILIQQRLRATLKIRKSAATKIQQYYKATILMRKQRISYGELKSTTLMIQHKFRANRDMKIQNAEYLKLKKYTIIIQKIYKANCAMKYQRSNFLRMKNATIFIQQKLRATLKMRKQKAFYFELKLATLRIQQQYRAIKSMNSQRSSYLQLKQAAIVFQQRYKALRLMKNQRAEYLHKHQLIIRIQQQFRANKAMRLHSVEYLKLKCSVLSIQHRFRAKMLARKESRNYQKFRTSVILIQQKLRATLLARQVRMQYITLEYNTILMQQRFRSNKLMEKERAKYLKLKSCTVFIQQTFRAKKLMRSDKAKFILIRNSSIKIQQYYRSVILRRKEHSNYLQIKHSAIVFQQHYRAKCKMEIERFKYNILKQSTLIIQKRFRANSLMKQDRAKFLKLKKSVIYIQHKFRANLLMQKQKTEFLRIKNSTITIQRKFRTFLAMRIQRLNFLKIKNATITIQKYYRAQKLMQYNRNHFEMLKSATIVFQRRYRAHREMLKMKNQYMLIRSLIICIQRKFKANYLMKIERDNFLFIKFSVIIIQQKYRAQILMREQRQKYLEIRKTTLGLQSCCRGFLARQKFNAMMTPEMREFLKQKKAAKTIQSYWRGYMIRKKWQNIRLIVIRERIRELKGTATACNTLRYKISAAIKFLNGKRFNVQEELNVLQRLENLSRTVPHLLMDHSKFIATFCYGIMAQAIRSEADKQIIELCSRIILNLARYNSTTANTFQENGLVTVAQMLLRWCDKDCGIFNTLCTLIYVFSQSAEKSKKIREYMTNTEAIYMLRETKKMVLRKEKMRQNVRKLNITTPVNSKQPTFGPRALPGLEPDFGLIQGKPYVFISSVFAFEVILDRLGIKRIF